MKRAIQWCATHCEDRDEDEDGEGWRCGGGWGEIGGGGFFVIFDGPIPSNLYIFNTLFFGNSNETLSSLHFKTLTSNAAYESCRRKAGMAKECADYVSPSTTCWRRRWPVDAVPDAGKTASLSELHLMIHVIYFFPDFRTILSPAECWLLTKRHLKKLTDTVTFTLAGAARTTTFRTGDRKCAGD